MKSKERKVQVCKYEKVHNEQHRQFMLRSNCIKSRCGRNSWYQSCQSSEREGSQGCLWIRSRWGVGKLGSTQHSRQGGRRRTGKRKDMSLKVGWMHWVWVSGCLGHSNNVEARIRARCLSPEHCVLSCPIYTEKPSDQEIFGEVHQIRTGFQGSWVN